MDFVITAILTVFILANIMNLGGLLLWVERKGSAVLQDRIGANRAVVAQAALNTGIINTLVADPIKPSPGDFIPPNADKLLHALAPALAMVPALTFIAIPFGDILVIGERQINLQAAT
jgi:NADH-quinone oxidoreductase subunit H